LNAQANKPPSPLWGGASGEAVASTPPPLHAKRQLHPQAGMLPSVTPMHPPHQNTTPSNITASGKRRASMGKWTEEEDDLLRRAVNEFGGRSWKKIAMRLNGRTDVQCLHRWQKVLKPGLIKVRSYSAGLEFTRVFVLEA